MTKKLSELFDLQIDDEVPLVDEPLPNDSYDVMQNSLSNLEKIENALPQVRGLDASDMEMDHLAKLAEDSFNDLSNLGMQVDSRFSSEIFNVAGTMLGHAITAKTAKINKKIKMIELQLKKAALDQKIASKDKEIEATPLGNASLLDRNELLTAILTKKNNDK